MDDLAKAKEILKGNSVQVKVLKYAFHSDPPEHAEIILSGKINATLEFILEYDADMNDYGAMVDASGWYITLKSGELPEGFLDDVKSLRHRDLDDYAYDIEYFVEQEA